MKQKRFGKKVQNWHRPLQSNQLRRRYLRIRYADEESEREIDGTAKWLDSLNDYRDPCGDHHCRICNPWLGERDFKDYRISQWLSDNLGYSPLLTTQALAKQIIQDAGNQTSDHSLRSLDVEQRLRRFDALINSGKPDDIIRWLSERLDDPHENDFVSFHCNNDSALTKKLLLFSPFWIRSPYTFAGGSIRQFVEHLFVKYPPPAFLFPSWTDGALFDNIKWRIWFVALAQGASLRRLSQSLNWKVSNKFVARLTTVPASFHPHEACLYALVSQLGGSHQVFEWIKRSPSFVLDPTDTEDIDEEFRSFWCEVVCWLIKHENRLYRDRAMRVLTWAHHCHLETHRIDLGQDVHEPRSATFRIKGRSLESVLRLSHEYDQQIRVRFVPRAQAKVSWQPKGWDWEYHESPNHWEFRELTNSEQLYREGSYMRHCVGSYSYACVNQTSAIFSVRVNESRIFTIEINPKTQRLIQARGFQNRSVTKDENRILTLWMQEIASPDFKPS